MLPDAGLLRTGVPETFVAGDTGGPAGEGGCIDGREHALLRGDGSQRWTDDQIHSAAYSAANCDASASYKFMCRSAASVSFDLEVMAP